MAQKLLFSNFSSVLFYWKQAVNQKFKVAIKYYNLHYFLMRFCGNNSVKTVAYKSLIKWSRTVCLFI